LDVHPHQSATESFFQVANFEGKGVHENPSEAQNSLGKLEEFDGYSNVLTVISHDQTLLDILDFNYPKGLSDWHSNGYKERGMWEFVRDFSEAVKLD
jgi:hypothetical protein